MRWRNPVRTIFALVVIAYLLVLFVVPGVSSGMYVQANGGKQMIRVLTIISLAALILAVYRGVFRSTSLFFYPFRQVYAHGFGPDLLDKTCARLC